MLSPIHRFEWDPLEIRSLSYRIYNYVHATLRATDAQLQEDKMTCNIEREGGILQLEGALFYSFKHVGLGAIKLSI